MKLAPLSRFTEQESIDAFCEGIRDAASLARELAKHEKKRKWVMMAEVLDKIHYKGQMLTTAKSLSRLDTLVALDRETKKISAQQPAPKTTPKIILN